MTFSLVVQMAIYAELTEHAPLMAAVKGVYDDVPQPPDTGGMSGFPYVTIGEDILREWDTDTELGADGEIAIHVWSRERGRRETKLIQGHIYDALHRADVEINGFHVVTLEWISDESFLDPDGHTRHGVSRYRVLLERE